MVWAQQEDAGTQLATPSSVVGSIEEKRSRTARQTWLEEMAERGLQGGDWEDRAYWLRQDTHSRNAFVK